MIVRDLHGDNIDQTNEQLPIDGTMPEVHWLLTDHCNSVRLVLDETGTIIDRIASDAFGNIVAQRKPMLDRFV